MLSGETILLTGGAGFIGSTLARRLVDHNRVRIFDTFDRDALSGTLLDGHPNVQRVRGDVRDPEQMLNAMRGVDRVVHLASVAGVGTVLAQPVRTMRVALEGTANVLEAAREVGDVKRIVCFSTSEVFGRMAYNVTEGDDTPIGPVDEPRWTYAVAKIAAEHLAHSYGRQFALPVVTLRPFNVYGPGQIGEGAIHNFIRRALRDESITVNNDGRQIRSWCYVDDMVDATLASLERGEAAGQAFNIGNPSATVTVYHLAEMVKRLAESRSEIKFETRDYPDVEVRVPNVNKARRLLAWQPKVGVEEGIARTLRWYRDHAE